MRFVRTEIYVWLKCENCKCEVGLDISYMFHTDILNEKCQGCGESTNSLKEKEMK